jgi:hypothetical protein
MQKMFVTILVLMFPILCFGQNDKTDDEIKFSICKPTITESGRQSSFQFSYRYFVYTDTNGKIEKVKEVGDFTKFRHLMDDKDVIPCIKKWKLKPSQRYLVTINVGTTSAENSFTISNKTMVIKFIL